MSVYRIFNQGEIASLGKPAPAKAGGWRSVIALAPGRKWITVLDWTTLETARLVAPDNEPESWPQLEELRGGRLADIPEDGLEEAFVGCFRGVVVESTLFLGGETIGSLLDRVLIALDRLLADESWDTVLAVLHGGVNRAILSRALTGGRAFLGGFEQAPACINVIDIGRDWIVRAVNTVPYDLAHAHGRQTTMEELYAEFRGLV